MNLIRDIKSRDNYKDEIIFEKWDNFLDSDRQYRKPDKHTNPNSYENEDIESFTSK